MTTTPPVLLRPITDSEYPDWRRRANESFAAGVGPARGLGPDDALRLANEEIDKLLPQRAATADQLIWIAWAGHEPVGSLWISTRTGIPFIFGIEVHSGQRGNGYGRAIMLAGENECRRRGYARLDLNVFGTNRTAISLYESLGYTVSSQQMSKRL